MKTEHKRILAILYDIAENIDKPSVDKQISLLQKNINKIEELSDVEISSSQLERIVPKFSYYKESDIHEGLLSLLGISAKLKVTSKSGKDNIDNIDNLEDALNSGTPESVYVFTLNLGRFANFIISCYSKANNDKINQIWRIYDPDNTGFISQYTLTTLLLHCNQSQNMLLDTNLIEEISFVLQRKINKSNSGFISKQEFISHLEEILKRKHNLVINIIKEEKINPEVKRTTKEENKDNKITTRAMGKCTAYFMLNRKKIFWLTVYIVTNIFWSGYFFLLVYDSQFVSLAIAKSFAGIILWNTSLLLFFVCKNIISLVNSVPIISTIFPFDDIGLYHKLCARMFIVGSLGHTLAHLLGTYRFITSHDLNIVNKFLLTKLQKTPSYLYLLFETVYGITGVILVILLILILVTTMEKIIRKHYELFWYTHKIYLLILVTIFIHVSGKLVANSVYWKFIIGPGTLFLFELTLQWTRYFRSKSKIISIKSLPSDVVEIILEKPKGFTFKPGQYALINVPEINFFQFHPFTIASAPHHNNLVFYISPVGTWSKDLKKLSKHFLSGNVEIFAQEKNNFNSIKAKTHFLFYDKNPMDSIMIKQYCRIDGPYGAPCLGYRKYKRLLLIAAGIGATPFASILYSMINSMRVSYQTDNLPYEVEFIWVVRKYSLTSWMIHLIKRVLQEDKDKRFKITLHFTSSGDDSDLRAFILWYGLDLLKEQKVVKGFEENLVWGRPNWDELFKKKYEILSNSGENKIRVGVFVCANYGICQDVFISSKKYSDDKVKFNFHKENF